MLSPNNDIVKINPLLPPDTLFTNIMKDTKTKDDTTTEKEIVRNPIQNNSTSRELESKLNLYFEALEDYIEELELLDIEIYRVAERYQRKELEFIIMSNIY